MKQLYLNSQLLMRLRWKEHWTKVSSQGVGILAQQHELEKSAILFQASDFFFSLFEKRSFIGRKSDVEVKASILKCHRTEIEYELSSSLWLSCATGNYLMDFLRMCVLFHILYKKLNRYSFLRDVLRIKLEHG